MIAALVAFAIVLVVDIWRGHLYRTRSRQTLQTLHERGMHEAATIARRILQPNEFPTVEQLAMMKRDG
jgi:hypothetical protein